MDGGKDWLECILKRKAFEETPIKILEVEEGSSPGKGENYLSKIRKVRAKVLLGSGKIKIVSLLIKCEHQTEHMKKMSVDEGIFLKEITMYRDVLPKMQELLEDIEDPEGIFWAKCYDFRLYDRLVFEDLGESGYRMADRVKQLSLNAALLAVRHLAKFHALSKILLDRGDIPVDIVGECRWMKNPEECGDAKRMVAMNLVKMSMRMESWGDEWREAAERLGAANLAQQYMNLFDAQPDEFVVLCHGDFWTNNMMFKGEDLENPTSFRLIDLQLCFTTTPAKDLSQFFISSVRLEDRKQHLNLLLQTYSDTLTSYLLKLGYAGRTPTFEDIKSSYESRSAMQLCDAISFIPLMTGDADDAPDVEQALKKLNEAKVKGEEATMELFSSQKTLKPSAEAIIKYEIKKAMGSRII